MYIYKSNFLIYLLILIINYLIKILYFKSLNLKSMLSFFNYIIYIISRSYKKSAVKYP